MRIRASLRLMERDGRPLSPRLMRRLAVTRALNGCFASHRCSIQKAICDDLLDVEKLARTHAVEQFTCGQPELDRFLTRHALRAQQANSSQTYVAVSDNEVVGFYTIVAGEVHHTDAPERVVKGMPRHPIPLLVWPASLFTRRHKAAASVPDCCSMRSGAPSRLQM